MSNTDELDYDDMRWNEIMSRPRVAPTTEATDATAAKERIESGQYTNADLDAVVTAGLAQHVYGDPDSNRPTGIEWLSTGNPYGDQEGIEEVADQFRI